MEENRRVSLPNFASLPRSVAMAGSNAALRLSASAAVVGEADEGAESADISLPPSPPAAATSADATAAVERDPGPDRGPEAQEQEQEISLSRVVSMLEQNSGRSSNKVTTGRYNHVTFVPLMLYKLLNPRTNFCNFFFLCIGFLQMVPAITISAGVPNQFVALSIIIIVEMVFEWREDRGKHKADTISNGQPVRILRSPEDSKDSSKEAGSRSPPSWVDATWEEVRVGDVLLVYNRQGIPADLLLLRASMGGKCWVDTKVHLSPTAPDLPPPSHPLPPCLPPRLTPAFTSPAYPSPYPPPYPPSYPSSYPPSYPPPHPLPPYPPHPPPVYPPPHSPPLPI